MFVRDWTPNDVSGFVQRCGLLAGAFVALFALGLAAPASAQDRYAAIVMDARTNEVLLEDQADEARFPASLTKMMTLYMIFEALERGDITMDTRWTASRNASRQPPSRLGLACSRRRGCDSITVEQAIRALVVQSANDVATMVGRTPRRHRSPLRRQHDGPRPRTRPDRHPLRQRERPAGHAPPHHGARHGHASARRCGVIFLSIITIFQTPNFRWRRASGRNHNRLLGQVEGVDGIKTGYTRASGFNLATMTERNGRRVIVVVLGGETAAARDAQVAYLIEGAYQEYARRADPNAAPVRLMPTRRLDVQLAPGTLQASAADAAAALALPDVSGHGRRDALAGPRPDR